MVYTPEAPFARSISTCAKSPSVTRRADYYQTGPGRGEQHHFFSINHVALVPAGRCGSSCAPVEDPHTRRRTQ